MAWNVLEMLGLSKKVKEEPKKKKSPTIKKKKKKKKTNKKKKISFGLMPINKVLFN